MNPFEIDIKANEFTEADLDTLGKVLILADDIKADKAVFDAVTRHMNGQAKKIKSLSDLRNRADDIATKPEPIKGGKPAK